MGRATLDGMRYLSVIDRAGNEKDYETEFVPRIGERIQLEYAVILGSHYFGASQLLRSAR
jgi:hypothetical protein